MSKIYVIAYRDVDYYEIFGVTDDLERANALAKFFSREGESASIEEYEIIQSSSKAIERVSDMLDNGAAYIYSVNLTKAPGSIVWDVQETVKANWLGDEFYLCGNTFLEKSTIFEAYIFAEDEFKALEIAQNMYAKMKAENVESIKEEIT